MQQALHDCHQITGGAHRAEVLGRRLAPGVRVDFVMAAGSSSNSSTSVLRMRSRTAACECM
jgi:hypothetical protein